jgi:hypothetical protein
MARTTQDISKSVPQITEELVLGGTGIRSGATALASFAQVPVKGIYVCSFAFDAAALTNTVTVQLQEVSITDSTHAVRVAVGDLFIPFGPPIGAGAGTLDSTVTVVPAKAVTIDKAPVQFVNLTAAATNPGLITYTYLWIKVA